MLNSDAPMPANVQTGPLDAHKWIRPRSWAARLRAMQAPQLLPSVELVVDPIDSADRPRQGRSSSGQLIGNAAGTLNRRRVFSSSRFRGCILTLEMTKASTSSGLGG